MSSGNFNKKNGELDFSNIKQSQFGMGNAIRASFSELQSALRTFRTNAILKDAYTHFVQTLNGDDLPTHVEYWQATSPSKEEITFVADISSSLLNDYIIFEEYISKRTILLYYDVDGNGVAPGIADEEYPVSILENDSAFIVARSTYDVLNTLSDHLTVKSVGGTLYTKVEVQFMQFGPASPINLGTTGFSSTQTKVGTSFKVGEVYLDYDVDGNTIYNGNTLKGLLYNPYTASFDVERDEITVTAVTNLDPVISKTPTIYNVAMVTAGTEYSQALPIGTKYVRLNIKDHKGKYTVGWVSGGTVVTKSPGSFYEREGLEIVATDDTVYFIGTKDNIIMEIESWK